MSHLIEIDGPTENETYNEEAVFNVPMPAIAIATIGGRAVREMAEANGFNCIKSSDGVYFGIVEDEDEVTEKPAEPEQPSETELNARIIEQAKRLILNTLSKPSILQPQQVDTCMKLEAMLVSMYNRGIK